MVRWVVMLSRGELDMTLLNPPIFSFIKEKILYEKETKAVPLGNQDLVADRPRVSLVPPQWEHPEGREFCLFLASLFPETNSAWHMIDAC